MNTELSIDDITMVQIIQNWTYEKSITYRKDIVHLRQEGIVGFFLLADGRLFRAHPLRELSNVSGTNIVRDFDSGVRVVLDREHLMSKYFSDFALHPERYARVDNLGVQNHYHIREDGVIWSSYTKKVETADDEGNFNLYGYGGATIKVPANQISGHSR